MLTREERELVSEAVGMLGIFLSTVDRAPARIGRLLDLVVAASRPK
ncbi:hypothetical protein [Amycolatopsis sp. NBC_00438]